MRLMAGRSQPSASRSEANEDLRLHCLGNAGIKEILSEVKAGFALNEAPGSLLG
jgi:hypothetical protein